jgi:hypothetical protein
MAWNKENASKVRPGTDILLILYCQKERLIFEFFESRNKKTARFCKAREKKHVKFCI